MLGRCHDLKRGKEEAGMGGRVLITGNPVQTFIHRAFNVQQARPLSLLTERLKGCERWLAHGLSTFPPAIR